MAALISAGALVAVGLVSAGPSAAGSRSPGAGRHTRPGHTNQAGGRDGLGIQPGKVKHVWLIILENKSYDASFTGLNDNTYLWRSLPRQGVLLKNYYGTGHFSEDNYLSLASGEATEPDTQDDCPQYDSFGGSVDMSGSLETNPNFGQMTSAAGPDGAPGANGCVYPATVPTLFNQLDQAGRVDDPAVLVGRHRHRRGVAHAADVGPGGDTVPGHRAPTGNGQLRWAPLGGRPVASWDFEAEID